MNIALKILVVFCLTLCSFSAAGDNNRRSQYFLMFTAGDLNVNVVQLQINDPFDPADDTLEPTSIIDEKSIGTLGRAKLKTFSKVIFIDEDPNDAFPPMPEVPNPADCPDGFPIPLVTTDDAIVLTFHDLSQLVGSSRTIVCIDESGTQGIRGKGHWTSGTHRFANVTGGTFHLRSTATPQSTNGQFYSTVGSLNGRITRR